MVQVGDPLQPPKSRRQKPRSAGVVQMISLFSERFVPFNVNVVVPPLQMVFPAEDVIEVGPISPLPVVNE